MASIVRLQKENVVTLRKWLKASLSDRLDASDFNKTTLASHLGLTRDQVRWMLKQGAVPAEYLPHLAGAFELDSLTDLYLPIHAIHPGHHPPKRP